MRLLGNLIDIYLLLLIGRILLSWFPISPESPMSTVFSFLYRITEPVLGPIRRMLPPIGMGGMALDLSPIIVIFGLEILKNALVR
ncbi:MAG: YggT family protein [Actinobacteria bacterium]|nr:YggT family protein [Actinomycetota bacterium]MBV8958497.1 YggT family protein [Actinomycetota bacterium]MBV9255735.1 YggT family protein [Actinomycetota bacterium]